MLTLNERPRRTQPLSEGLEQRIVRAGLRAGGARALCFRGKRMPNPTSKTTRNHKGALSRNPDPCLGVIQLGAKPKPQLSHRLFQRLCCRVLQALMERSLSLSSEGSVALLGMCWVQLRSSTCEGSFVFFFHQQLLYQVPVNLLNGCNLGSLPVSHKLPQKDTARAGVILAPRFCKNKHCG